MRILMIVALLTLMAGIGNAQKNKSTIPPPPPLREMPKEKSPYSNHCYEHISRAKKGSSVYVTERLLQLNAGKNHCRITVSNYSYNEKTHKKVMERKDMIVAIKEVTFIDASYEVHKNSILVNYEENGKLKFDTYTAHGDFSEEGFDSISDAQ